MRSHFLWARSSMWPRKRRCTFGCPPCQEPPGRPQDEKNRDAVGGWLLERISWTSALALASGAILVCFVGAVLGGSGTAVYLLPASGLFMSVIYPAVNSNGISCFPKSAHGAIAGVILFFTCLSAVIGPLAMGAVSDAMGHPKYGFMLATGFAGVLFAGSMLDWLFDPARERLNHLGAGRVLIFFW